jgi:hypothetical protein
MEVAYRDVGELRHRLLHRQIAEALKASTRMKSTWLPGRWPGTSLKATISKRLLHRVQAGQQAARLAAGLRQSHSTNKPCKE